MKIRDVKLLKAEGRRNSPTPSLSGNERCAAAYVEAIVPVSGDEAIA
jgi:hypothetical protein